MSIERLNFSTENRYNSLESSIHVARYMIAKEFVKYFVEKYPNDFYQIIENEVIL